MLLSFLSSRTEATLHVLPVKAQAFHKETLSRARLAMNAEELYLLHKDRVFRLCLRYCGGQIALAEDLTQDVFIKMLEELATLQERESLEGWLYRVTTNACFTRLKRDTSVWYKVRQVLSLAPQSTSHTPERQVEVRQDLEQTMSALQRLPAKERVVFCMATLDERPQQEICDVLGLSKGYVSKLLHRARARLQGWEQGEPMQRREVSDV